LVFKKRLNSQAPQAANRPSGFQSVFSLNFALLVRASRHSSGMTPNTVKFYLRGRSPRPRAATVQPPGFPRGVRQAVLGANWWRTFW